MKMIRLQVVMSEKELKKEMERFHFDVEEFPLMKEVYYQMQKRIKITAWYEMDKKLPHSVVAIVTLGEGIDKLQEEFAEREAVLEAYMIECLSMIFLQKTYEKLMKAIEVEEKTKVMDFTFFGDNASLDEMEEVVNCSSSDTGVRCTKEKMLVPTKSVVMQITLKNEKAMATSEGKAEADIAECGVLSKMCRHCKRKCEHSFYP